MHVHAGRDDQRTRVRTHAHGGESHPSSIRPQEGRAVPGGCPPHARAQARERVVDARKRFNALGALEGALVRLESSLGEASGSARAVQGLLHSPPPGPLAPGVLGEPDGFGRAFVNVHERTIIPTLCLTGG